jgi:hypothetical protein
VAFVPAAPPPHRSTFEVEPLTGDLRRLHLTVSKRLLDKLDAARDALSHSHPGASRDEIIEAGLDLLLERQAKRRGLVKNPRKKAPPPAPSAREPAAPAPVRAEDPGRYVPADIRRAIWERDQGKCHFPIDGGGICGCTYQVEIDHIEPFAKGGRILKPEDGRILCRPHQLLSARREYGDACVGRFAKRPERAAARPSAATPGPAPGTLRA